MANDLFGGPIGTIAFNEDAQTRAQTQETLGRIAAQPTALRLLESKADLSELELQEEKRVAEILGRHASGAESSGALNVDGTPKSMSSIYGDLAKLAAGAGAPNKAADWAKLSGTLKSQEAAAARSQSLQELNALKAQKERLDLTSRLLQDVTDDESWNRAQLLYQVTTGEESMFAGLPYSSDLVERIRDAGMTTNQQIDQRRKAVEGESRERSRESLRTYRSTVSEVARERLKQAEAREARLAKGGAGKGVVSPPKAEVDQAIRLLKGDFKDLAQEDYMNAAYEIASEARTLRQRNPALDSNTAITQAFVSAKSRGDFKDVVEKGLLFDKTKKAFVGGGRTAETALSIPEDKGKLVKGRWYTGQGGKVGQWTGSGFKVNPENPRAGMGAAVEDDEDDSEGDAE